MVSHLSRLTLASPYPQLTRRYVCYQCFDPIQSLSITKLSTPGDTPKGVSRSSTPAPQAEGSSSESASVDDALLRQCAAVIADVKLLESKTWVLWRDEISPMIGSSFIEEDVPSEYVQAEGASLCYFLSCPIKFTCFTQMPSDWFCRA